MTSTPLDGEASIFCRKCGQKNRENNFRCTRCNEPRHPDAATSVMVAGLLALRDIRANPAKLGKGRAVFGVVMGALGSLLLVAIIFR